MTDTLRVRLAIVLPRDGRLVTPEDAQNMIRGIIGREGLGHPFSVREIHAGLRELHRLKE